MIKLNCDECAIVFNRRLTAYNYKKNQGTTKFYCSKKCSRLALRKYSGTIRECKFCGKKFSPTARDHNFCSHSCAASYNNATRPTARTSTKVWCACGNKKSSKSIKCQECREVVYNNRTLEDLKGSQSKRSNYHSIIRGQARKNYLKAMSCLICNYDLYVEICHIKAVKDFPISATITEINDPGNLVALCRNHHWEFDHGHINLIPDSY